MTNAITREQVDAVLDSFDFERVHRVMTFLDWRWAGSRAVPSIEMIRYTATELLDDCVRGFNAAGRPATGWDIATGGFIAQVTVFCDGLSEGKAELSLLFYVSEARSGAR